ncbi:MAG TPA: mechanosensitive ion channel family protein [Proteobacteria bacterium]|nr:mechanosensitive ion channel family protein [Pseudomonadota bacterium]
MTDSLFNRYVISGKWDDSILHFLPRILLAVLVLALFYLLAKIIRNYSLKLYTRILKKQTDLAKIISRVLYVLVIASGVIFALEILGLESYLTKLLAGAGIIGIVAGFAFKDIASNMFAGLLVNLQKPFKGDDWVKIDGEFGTIYKIGWITTSIKNISGQEVFVPNQLIYKSAFTNYSTFKKRRVIVRSGVSHSDDLEKVKRISIEEVGQIKALMKTEDIDFYFTSIGSYAYNFEVRFWIEFSKQTDYLNAMNEAIMRIKKRFEEENITIAYPVQSLDFGVKGGVNIFDKPIEIELNRSNN